MTIIVCTQEHICPDECIECGGWLHSERRGGYSGPGGRYCTEDCAADAQERVERIDVRTHLYARDLLCDCLICTGAGHPTAAELAEYQAYQEATPWT